MEMKFNYMMIAAIMEVMAIQKMPKIDTLDALGDAITTILTTNLPDMPKICYRYDQDVPKISKICAQICPKKCP